MLLFDNVSFYVEELHIKDMKMCDAVTAALAARTVRSPMLGNVRDVGYFRDKYGSLTPSHPVPLGLVLKPESEIHLHLYQHCSFLSSTISHCMRNPRFKGSLPIGNIRFLAIKFLSSVLDKFRFVQCRTATPMWNSINGERIVSCENLKSTIYSTIIPDCASTDMCTE